MAPVKLGQRLVWRVATVAAARPETKAARTLVLDVPGWPGHVPGQHVDVRLTAEDGYSTQRSYSLAGPADGERIELTVQEVPDGEVSPYLTDGVEVGDQFELRGPVGGYFVWRPQDPDPVLLVAGGSGIVPLMAMVRARRAAGSRAPFRLIASVRTPADRYYADELCAGRRPGDAGLDVTWLYTREGLPDALDAPNPPDAPDPSAPVRTPHRIDAADLAAHGWPADLGPACFVCGPTGFVEAVADLLVEQGHDPDRIRTERFGPSGG